MMRKIFETAAATVIAAGVIAAVANWSTTRTDAASAWSMVQSWAAARESMAWWITLSIFALNVGWWVVRATARRRGVDVFTGELTMPSMTSVLFTTLSITGAASLCLHLAAARTLWALLPGAVAGWLCVRAVSAAHYRWERLTGIPR